MGGAWAWRRARGAFWHGIAVLRSACDQKRGGWRRGRPGRWPLTQHKQTLN